MFRNLGRLVRYRGLIQSLVARELKARYRGSVLGFFWSFINPLLLLGIYSFIFTTILPNRAEGVQPYSLFMLCGAYTLAQNAHVRGDFLYSSMRPRMQAGLDIVLYIVFFLPGIAALIYSGYIYAVESWNIGEHSTVTANGPPIYQFKAMIPVAGALICLFMIEQLVNGFKNGFPPPQQPERDAATIAAARRAQASATFSRSATSVTTIRSRGTSSGRARRGPSTSRPSLKIDKYISPRPASSTTAHRPLEGAIASCVDIAHTGFPGGRAIPCIVARPMRTPVNEPGPRVTAKRSMLRRSDPLSFSRKSIAGSSFSFRELFASIDIAATRSSSRSRSGWPKRPRLHRRSQRRPQSIRAFAARRSRPARSRSAPSPAGTRASVTLAFSVFGRQRPRGRQFLHDVRDYEAVVSDHRGRIRVHSEKGRGTTFAIELARS